MKALEKDTIYQRGRREEMRSDDGDDDEVQNSCSLGLGANSEAETFFEEVWMSQNDFSSNFRIARFEGVGRGGAALVPIKVSSSHLNEELHEERRDVVFGFTSA